MGDDANGLAETYRRDGFVFPIDVLSDTEVRSIRLGPYQLGCIVHAR